VSESGEGREKRGKGEEKEEGEGGGERRRGKTVNIIKTYLRRSEARVKMSYKASLEYVSANI
jgi:hypothetical protein